MLCSVVANGLLVRNDKRRWEVGDFYLGSNPAFKPKPRRQSIEDMMAMVTVMREMFAFATVRNDG